MSHAQRRPLRYRGLRTSVPEHPASASTASASLLIAKAVLASTLALLITAWTVLVLTHSGRGNIPGDVILDVIFVLLTVWIDRHAIRRWRQTAARLPVDPSSQPSENRTPAA